MKKDAFYNENEPYAVEWLKNLSEAGHIAPGTIDGRSIVDLRPKDLEGFKQVHCFAGLGGWSYALRLAGWPDEVPVWTGSAPCQPWSQSGRRKGFKDERHLWPAWFKLIRKCRPRVVLGEQVGSPDGLRWLDAVFDDLEGAGYACGAADLPAASGGAPHIRQRLYFVAVSREQRREGKRIHLRPGQPRQAEPEAARGSAARELADAESERGRQGRTNRRRGEERTGSLQERPRGGSSEHSGALKLGHAGSARGRGNAGAVPRQEAQGGSQRLSARREPHVASAPGTACLVGYAGSAGSPERSRPEERFGAIRVEGAALAAPGATSGFWAEADWWLCRDGKARPAQPGSFPLLDGLPERVGRDGSVEAQPRVGRLKAYGNAIVPQQAALFIRAAASAMMALSRR